jgi:hypothetical protein
MMILKKSNFYAEADFLSIQMADKQMTKLYLHQNK